MIANKFQRKIEKVLAENNFIISEKEKQIIQTRSSYNLRYFYMTALRHEGGVSIKRFIKIPRNNTKKLLLPFSRQIEVAKYLKANKIIKTRGVIEYNYDPKKGVSFAIMETFPFSRDKIGFINNEEGVKLLGPLEAKNIISQLVKFHSISTGKLPLELKNILKVYPGNYKDMKRRIFRYLNKKVHPLDEKGKENIFYKVIERRLGISNIKFKINKLLDNAESLISAPENLNEILLHGDMAPNNLYVFNSGKTEFLDLEWVGTINNSSIGMIRDFGNLRARSWANANFRKYLDDSLLRAYKLKKQDLLGTTIIQLSILQSHFILSSFFENYDYAKQNDPIQIKRRLETESDLIQLFSN